MCGTPHLPLSCICSNKDKNFKANHNIYWCKVDGFMLYL